ncbi:hypothetical protein EDB81DRAFT_769923 [Dactylonectria macrodidyma]|uniref:Phosphoribosylaminoimidazole-succinocarboxamide synthase n=1 Tax=Dactylonectria macrodidyma TaxID=307937 RepID=A0A9P9JID9_9HYPO|nr:hypothetical protein EDB81DRAFT_769923 [Dactylonectria macrodidyma]
MNFQNLNFNHVEAPRRGPPTLSTTEPSHQDDDTVSLPTLRPYHDLRQRLDPSLSPQPTVVPHAPSPPSLSVSTNEIYGPDRRFHFGSPPPAAFAPPTTRYPNENSVRFDEAQIAMIAAENAARMANIKDELAIAAGKVTPGVDDTPYIQHALEALTRGRGGPAPVHFPSSSDDYDYSDEEYSHEDYAQPRRLPDDQSSFPSLSPPEPAYVEDRLPVEQVTPTERYVPVEPIQRIVSDEPSERYVQDEPAPRYVSGERGVDPDSSHETMVHHEPPVRSDSPTPSSQSIPTPTPVRHEAPPTRKQRRLKSIPIQRAHPPLDYKPSVLGLPSMIALMTLCVLMIAALIFSGVYSDSDAGLTPYPGSIYSGQYFLFRLLPQILSALILLYAQAVVAASLRTLPFTAMADEEPSIRYLALFRKLYPTTFLLPALNGPWQFQLFSVATWLANFTIPLQSTTFTCVFEDRRWIWTAVQGVVWTLVAIYIVLLVATAILMSFWINRWTGLLWDVRSVGHLVPLLNQSNTTRSYENVDVVQRGTLFKAQLRDRHLDRLGYWQTEGQRVGGMWYGIGSVADDDMRRQASQRVVAKKASYNISPASSCDDLEAEAQYVAHRYLPFALRDFTIIGSTVFVLLMVVGILVASFLPQTRLDQGFSPRLTARPGKGAFSAANFLYGFLPSLLGMVMFLLFQSLDLSLRVLQPWAELSKPSGSIAQKSLLADYAVCLPFQATWRAAKNGHWRVAVLSLMAVLFVFIPVLAGGLFMALTTLRGQVKMFPNMPVFGVLLAFLFLYLGCLVLMLPGRRAFRLPHPVTCLAELISLCAADDTTQDNAFRGIRSVQDLETRLGLDRADSREQSMWFFGVSTGRDERRLSVRPLQRFTEKRARSTRSTRSMI